MRTGPIDRLVEEAAEDHDKILSDSGKNRNRYMRIVHWARKRYNYCPHGGCAVLRDERGVASRYTIIETLAAERYMGCTPRTRMKRLTYPPFFQAPAR